MWVVEQPNSTRESGESRWREAERGQILISANLMKNYTKLIA